MKYVLIGCIGECDSQILIAIIHQSASQVVLCLTSESKKEKVCAPHASHAGPQGVYMGQFHNPEFLTCFQQSDCFNTSKLPITFHISGKINIIITWCVQASHFFLDYHESET